MTSQPVSTVHVMEWARCPICRLTFCQVDWIPARVAGYCSAECYEVDHPPEPVAAVVEQMALI